MQFALEGDVSVDFTLEDGRKIHLRIKRMTSTCNIRMDPSSHFSLRDVPEHALRQLLINVATDGIFYKIQ